MGKLLEPFIEKISSEYLRNLASSMVFLSLFCLLAASAIFGVLRIASFFPEEYKWAGFFLVLLILGCPASFLVMAIFQKKETPLKNPPEKTTKKKINKSTKKVSIKTNYKNIMNTVLDSSQKDWAYEFEGSLTYKHDVNLTIKRTQDLNIDNVFPEPWSKKFPDPKGYMETWKISYGTSSIKTIHLVCVDGGRGHIALPKNGYSENPTLTREGYLFGKLLHSVLSPFYPFYDQMLKRAKILVEKD